ncbi:MAG: MBL fold metallo-hydrolase [Bacteroidales bacterium]
MKKFFLFIILIVFFTSAIPSETMADNDIIETTAGSVKIHFLGHASLMLEFKGKTIYVDPWAKHTDFSNKPKADLILITHEHQDHLDQQAIAMISVQQTEIICNPAVKNIIGKGFSLKNGEHNIWNDINIEAVPAYNTTAGREKFHPKGRDNGYILNIGDKRIYIAGDTEDIPEMKSLGKIDIAFLPMNQPYTMTPDQVVHAVSLLKPEILYPYHTTLEDTAKLSEMMAANKAIDLRIRVTN